MCDASQHHTETIFVTTDRQAKLTGFDYARIDDRSGTIANQIGDELEAAVLYQDYECQHNPAQASPQSDLFAVGQVFYELLLGEPAFSNPDQMLEARGIFRLLPSEKRPQLPRASIAGCKNSVPSIDQIALSVPVMRLTNSHHSRKSPLI
jgi:serine/threonine protein kinase